MSILEIAGLFALGVVGLGVVIGVFGLIMILATHGE